MPTFDAIDNPDAPLHNTDFRAISEALAGNGIQSAGDFEITAGSADMEIDIAPGTAVYAGGTSSRDSAATKTITAADSASRRWDGVAWDHATASVVVRDGTPGAAAVPDVQGDEIYLGKIEVPAGASEITADEIYNWRVAAGGGGGTSDVQTLINRPNGQIERAEVENGARVDFGIPVPDGDTLEVYRWGCWQHDDTTPSGLDVVLLDESRTVQASANVDDSGDTTTVEASLVNSSGSLSHFYLGVQNGTGLDILASNSEWVTAIFAYQVV